MADTGCNCPRRPVFLPSNSTRGYASAGLSQEGPVAKAPVFALSGIHESAVMMRLPSGGKQVL